MTRVNKKMRNRRRGRGRVINDVPRNDTNIRVRFKKAITFDYVSNQDKLLLNPGISTLTKDLAVVYKLYRCTHFKLTWQAATFASGTGAQPRYAVNYVPALESTTSSPLTIEDYEGPAVGYWQSNRGHPYIWKIPGNVLNAMPYNWYETKSNTPDTSDLTQGAILTTTDLETDSQTALLEVVFEFQTLEDPDFLASLVRDNRTNPDFEIIKVPRKRYEQEEEWEPEKRSESIHSIRQSRRERSQFD